MMKMSAKRFLKYYSMIPRLQAEEALLNLSVINSALAGDEKNPFLDKLKELAGIKEEEVATDDILLFSSIGIKVERKE